MNSAARRLGMTVLLTGGIALADPAALSRAQDLYQRTLYDEALRLLQIAAERTAAVSALAGKCHYQLEQYKEAVEALEQAVRAAPGNADYHNWLGKAYGRRAENSSFLTAPKLAGKARDSFQRAVELDPRNLDAVSNLFEYYLEAPGFLGGGDGKAARLAETVKDAAPPFYHWLQARLAEKRKDYQDAELHYRTAAKLAPEEAGRLVDLAKFLFARNRAQEGEAVFRDAEKLAPGDPGILFGRASAYIRMKRNLDEARELLGRYLNAQLTPDLPSRKEAERLLARARSG